ncbi:uncharacterized protein EI90DRAFT_3036532 [Cantharellus anzutake]|uniref:uncharacterized protein n=1 Tax=Cantharellus anzutake TaxID=1750568 RepID=UPI0019059525|nr:uncharacterized protein EI90DRAFT_3036532 [Cantharellus anzutake]KAF8340702.1 hypothetical protein EI90DRAFT_3036532 [Cantharellus anzutake]
MQSIGQHAAWQRHHRRLCKKLSTFLSMAQFQPGDQSVQSQSLLLCHLLLEHFSDLGGGALQQGIEIGANGGTVEHISERNVLLSLLPHPEPQQSPPLPLFLAKEHSHELIQALSSRSVNNDWVIYSSSLHPIGHGVFPRASRYFNHSCSPSAVQVYTFDEAGPIMHIKALKNLSAGEEITVTYIDPAHPYDVRKKALDSTYGFECHCRKCQSDKELLPSISVPPSSDAIVSLYPTLIRHVIPSLELTGTSEALPEVDPILPPHLLTLLSPSHLPYLSEAFSKAAHSETPKEETHGLGLALLAMYFVIYPPYYPLIGRSFALSISHRFTCSLTPMRLALS